MPRDRSISPVGTSRFERPYTPPWHSTAQSPTSMEYPPSEKAPASRYGIHFHKPSKASTVGSLRSDQNTYSTAPTSLNTSPTDEYPDREGSKPDDHHSMHAYDDNMNIVDADEWFARFRSDTDLADEPLSDECPDRATLAAAYNIPVYSADGTAMPFGQLYHPATATHPRQLIIFVRHFYCGACQAYLKALTDNITMPEYFSIPIPTSIIVIGCGSPNLIPFYKAVTGCPFPIFAEPSRQLFKRLGMVISVNIGTKRPEYMKDISPAAWAAGQVTTIRQGLKVRKAAAIQAKLDAQRSHNLQAQLHAQEELDNIKEMEKQSMRSNDSREPAGMSIRKRDIVKGGNPFQIGGEFLFEEGEVIWASRMKNYRDHAEVKVIRKVLELDD